MDNCFECECKQITDGENALCNFHKDEMLASAINYLFNQLTERKQNEVLRCMLKEDLQNQKRGKNRVVAGGKIGRDGRWQEVLEVERKPNRKLLCIPSKGQGNIPTKRQTSPTRRNKSA